MDHNAIENELNYLYFLHKKDPITLVKIYLVQPYNKPPTAIYFTNFVFIPPKLLTSITQLPRH